MYMLCYYNTPLHYHDITFTKHEELFITELFKHSCIYTITVTARKRYNVRSRRQ